MPGIDLNPADLQTGVEQGMKSYLLQFILNSTGCDIFHEAPPLKADCEGSGVRFSSDGSCDMFGYTFNEFSGPNDPGEFQSHPNNIYGTLTLDIIFDSEIACAAAGSSVATVDIDAFLEDGNSVPGSFFGFSATNDAGPLPQDKPAHVTSDPKGSGVDK
jgi:hypothetical protein